EYGRVFVVAAAVVQLLPEAAARSVDGNEVSQLRRPVGRKGQAWPGFAFLAEVGRKAGQPQIRLDVQVGAPVQLDAAFQLPVLIVLLAAADQDRRLIPV